MPKKCFSHCPQKVIILFTTKEISFFKNMENEGKKQQPAVEENCSEVQKSKLLCCNEAVNGATVGCAFLSQSGALRTETVLML